MILPRNDSAGSINRDANMQRLFLKDDGIFPNNECVPLIVYKGVIVIEGADPAAVFEGVFQENNWFNSWRNGVYPFHHYHSTAHEVLGVYAGSATVCLGGETNGISAEITQGDVIIIPAGVSHKNLGNSTDFAVVGAYPDGQRPDMQYGKPGERPGTDQIIKSLSLPTNDPVLGSTTNW